VAITEGCRGKLTVGCYIYVPVSVHIHTVSLPRKHAAVRTLGLKRAPELVREVTQCERSVSLLLVHRDYSWLEYLAENLIRDLTCCVR
jgi:hypothetical protein